MYRIKAVKVLLTFVVIAVLRLKFIFLFMPKELEDFYRTIINLKDMALVIKIWVYSYYELVETAHKEEWNIINEDGKKPQKHTTIDGYTYENGYYKFSKASGEVYTFSQIDKLYDLGNGTCKAEVSIYTVSSGFTGDSHGTLEQWKASGKEIPKLDKKSTQ